MYSEITLSFNQLCWYFVNFRREDWEVTHNLSLKRLDVAGCNDKNVALKKVFRSWKVSRLYRYLCDSQNVTITE